MMPLRRDYSFQLPSRRLRDWHPDGLAVSQLFNAMSLFFPVGERFFIGSVRHYRARIGNAELRRAVTAFIGQEAMHGREHESYNRLLLQSGLPAATLERLVEQVLGAAQKVLPQATQLAVTIALEHFTAILADQLLDNPRMLDGAQAEYRRLWLWHALEETEHKGVAYDVWREMLGDGAGAYALRCGTMLFTAAAFVILVAAFSAVLIEHDGGRREAGRLSAYRPLASFLFGRDGLMRRGFAGWRDYFRPAFHPWDHDNRHLLRRMPEVGPLVPAPLAQAA